VRESHDGTAAVAIRKFLLEGPLVLFCFGPFREEKLISAADPAKRKCG
jgi:hypothetical protein